MYSVIHTVHGHSTNLLLEAGCQGACIPRSFPFRKIPSRCQKNACPTHKTDEFKRVQTYRTGIILNHMSLTTGYQWQFETGKMMIKNWILWGIMGYPIVGQTHMFHRSLASSMLKKQRMSMRQSSEKFADFMDHHETMRIISVDFPNW